MTDPALEHVEQQALVSWHGAASRTAGTGFDWRLERVGDALCSVSGSEPGILLDRVLLASSGAIFIDGDTGYVDWGATHPDFRRRGSQTALLNARLRHALAAGCSRVVTMTGEAVPGDPQHSYRNILRAAIRERYCRENWLPAD